MGLQLSRAFINGNAACTPNAVIEEESIGQEHNDSILSDQLIRAIRNRKTSSASTDDIQKLIDQGADVNRRDDDGDSPLDWACKNSDIHCLRLLLQNGARVDVSGRSPLHHLTLRGNFVHANNIECFKLLLQYGVDVNACGSSNETPLYWATRNNNIECVELLLHHGADTNVCDSNNKTPLHWAAYHNKIEYVKLLLQHGANTNACDSNNKTPLYWAVRRGNVEYVKLILQHGADVDVLDNNHDSVLNMAACHCRLEIIKTLLEYNANVNIRNLRGQTPLMQAAIEASRLNTERSEACLELLIQASGQFDLRDENGELKPDVPYCDNDHKRELNEMLLPYCVHPRSLQVFCRHQIRSSLHHQFLPDVIPSLNLPKKLERFVLLQ